MSLSIKKILKLTNSYLYVLSNYHDISRESLILFCYPLEIVNIRIIQFLEQTLMCL